MAEWTGAAYFDLDGTLLDGRSELTFYRRFSRTTSASRRLTIPFRWLSGVLRSLLSGRAPYDAFRNRRYIHGMPWAEICAMSEKVVAEDLPDRVSDAARVRIEWHREQGHRIVLLSATLQPLCDAFAERLGMHASIASLPTIDEQGRVMGHERSGRFPRRRGKLPIMLADAKEHGIELSDCWGYGNEHADSFFMEACGHPEAVNPSSKLRRLAEAEGWLIHSWKREG